MTNTTKFQSTRPVWGATSLTNAPYGLRRNFNPRAPCGARPSVTVQIASSIAISIHAPRVGRDRGRRAACLMLP